MIFKAPHMEIEWVHMVEQKMMLVPVVLYVAELSRVQFGKIPVVTSIFRSDDDHRALMERVEMEYRPTVHSHWRGVDLRSWIYEAPEIDALVQAANDRFGYGRGKKVAIYHDVGAGGHFHLQSPAQFGQWAG